MKLKLQNLRMFIVCQYDTKGLYNIIVTNPVASFVIRIYQYIVPLSPAIVHGDGYARCCFKNYTVGLIDHKMQARPICSSSSIATLASTLRPSLLQFNN